MGRTGRLIEQPNREKAGLKVTKVIVVLLLLVSAALVLIVTVGGWDALEGAKLLQVAFIVLYVVCAGFIMGWKRGLLPVVAALAIVLGIFAAVSAPAWFDRDKTGLTDPALDADLLGLICALIVPVQVLLIAFAMRGFAQQWNVEVEREVDDDSPSPPGRCATASPSPPSGRRHILIPGDRHEVHAWSQRRRRSPSAAGHGHGAGAPQARGGTATRLRNLGAVRRQRGGR